MEILIIGGTRYIGRYLVKHLLEFGHTITLFHRGKTNRDLYPELDRVIGDRNSDLDRLKGMTFDIVIDTCGYTPDQVEKSVSYLKNQVDNYIFISSIDAFEPTDMEGLTEGDSTQDDDFSPDKSSWWKTQYGRNKAICEQIVVDQFGRDKSLIIRPGMVIGPYDPILFFPYWVLRLKKGGTVLAPGNPKQPLQYIDVRDLTSFIASLVDSKVTGIFTVTGPYPSDTLGNFLDTIRSVVNQNAELTWVESAILLERDLKTDLDLPYWLPGKEARGYCNIDPSKATEQGLTFRPLVESTKDVLKWLNQHNTSNPDDPISIETIANRNRGLDPKIEEEILENT